MHNDWYNINWEALRFLRPEYLWLLVPAGLALVLGLVNVRRQEKWQKHIAPHLRRFVIQKGSEKKIRRLRIITVVILSLAVLGLAGPAWKKVEVPGKILESPVVVVLDLSQSMMAGDIQPSRLERAKFKINDLLKAHPRARIALIGFAGTAHVVVPLTGDYNIIGNYLEVLRPDIMPVPGTNLEAALQLADTVMKPVAAPGRIILFTDDFSEKAFKIIQSRMTNSTATLDIVAMNTPSGAVIDKPGTKVPFRDKNGKIVRSSLNKTIFKKLNSLPHVHVHRLTLDNSDMQLLAKTISDNLKFREEDTEKENEWEDRGLVLVIPLALLALLWFRKGWVIFSLVLMMGMTSCNSNTGFKDLWLSKDYQGQQEYEKGNYEKAAELFQSPLRQGVAWYKAGEYDKAIAAFEKDTTARGAYNLGLAYYKNGDYAQAAVAFGKATQLDPSLGDARKNMEIMQQLVVGKEETQPAEEVKEKSPAKNRQNKDYEDLGGGGQEATKEDMQKERKEETVETGKRKGKEMEEVPEDFKSGKSESMENIYMQRIDDDPALFLKRKFRYQLKKGMVQKPKKNEAPW